MERDIYFWKIVTLLCKHLNSMKQHWLNAVVLGGVLLYTLWHMWVQIYIHFNSTVYGHYVFVVVLKQSASNKTAEREVHYKYSNKKKIIFICCTKELTKAFGAAMLNEKIYCI